MKNKKIIVLLLVLFLLTGCTKQMKDVNKKVITASNTNQVLIENILCQPDSKNERKTTKTKTKTKNRNRKTKNSTAHIINNK